MSQAAYNVPTGGSFSMVTFAGLMNGAYNALATNNSGASAPANGPGSAPQEFQSWFNTTNVNFPIFNYFDGVNWDRVGTMDVAGSNWLPKMGGGVASLASAATVNIGASPQTYITITGVTTITSFGSSAGVGEEKKLQFSGNLKLTYNASLIVTPGLADINTQPGDSCVAIYQGGNVWQIFAFVRGLNTPGFSLPPGATFWMPSAGVAIPGAVRANGRSIGDASSGGTELASATAWPLFNYLWSNFTNTVLPVSGGGHGASAVADFAAHKNIQLPDLRGMVLAGLDDMGNSAASRLTSLTMTPDGISGLATGGSQVVTLTTAGLPAHSHTITDPGHFHTITPGTAAGAGPTAGGGVPSATANQNTDTKTTGITINNSTGGGGSHVNIQPTTVGTWYVCL